MTPSDDDGQTVVVQVSTTGQDPDPDGYEVRVGSSSAPVSSNGSVDLDGIPAGSHQVQISGVANNCLVQDGVERSVSVTGSSGGQVSFVVDCWLDFGDQVPTVACFDIAPSQNSGIPLDRIPIGNPLSGLGSSLFARIMTPDGAHSSIGLVIVDDAGQAELVTPIHPSASPGGGPVFVRVSDGDAGCPPFELAVDPLPPAPGELGEVVALLQDLLREQAAILETTPEALISTPVSDLPPALIPLATVQAVLDHPQNDRSLGRIADGTSSISEDAGLELYEPLLARTGLKDALMDAAAARQAAAPAASQVGVSALTCQPSQVGNDAGLLDRCMDAQSSAAFEVTGGAWNQVLSDVQSAFGVAEFVPGLGNVGAVGGATLWVFLNETQRTASLLPCCLTSFDIDASPVEFEEDNPFSGTWSATVTAVSLGWDLGKEVLEAALAAGNVGGALDAALDADNVAGPEVPQIMGAFLTGPFAEALLDGGTIEAWESPPQVFGPVGVGAQAWSESEIIGTAFEKTAHNDYRPREVGEATLALRTKGGAFGGQQRTEQIDLRVMQLGITISPQHAFVAPGEVKSFDVRVENAHFPDMVEVDQGNIQGDAEITTGDGGNHYVTYVAPTNPNTDTPDLLTVRHTAETGARENGPPQVAIATVEFGRVDISPQACVELSGEQTFTAEVLGAQDQTVHWTADVGFIDPDSGEYDAPPTRPASGTVTIRAVSTIDPDLFGEIMIPLGCTCASTLRIAGRTVVAQPGDRVFFTDWGGPTDPYGNNFEFFAIGFSQGGGVYAHGFPLDDDPSTWPTVDGYNPVRAQGTAGLIGPELLYSSDDEFPAILDLDEYTPEQRASGSLSAGVQIISTQPPYSTPATLEWTFSVTVPPGRERGPPLPPLGYNFFCTVGVD